MKKIILVSLIVSACFLSSAQRVNPGVSVPTKQSFKDRLYFGGNLGLQFGTQTVIMVNPIAGYMVTEKWSVGLGGKYQYYRYRDRTTEFSSDMYGGSVFTRYDVFNGLFAYSEYELLNLARWDSYGRENGRVDVGSWFLGAGYAQPLGNRSSMNVMILYNLTETIYSPYSNPVFRVGFGVGI